MEFIAVGLASVVLGAWLRTVPQQGRAALEATGQLLDAARHGRLSIITSLVDSGVPVDSPGDAGETALMAAAGAGQTSAVELLLSLGASVTARMEDHLGKASSTRGLASGGGAAHAAAAAGSHEVLTMLVERNETVAHTCDSLGNSPLHVACIHGQAAAAHLCLARDVEIDERNDAGCTPLALAASHGSVEAVRLCLEKGASVDAVDVEANTPLHRACVYDHAPVAAALLDAGANLYQTNARGASPIELGASHPAVRELLRERAAQLASDGHEQAGKADASRSRLEAQLVQLARTEPASLNALLQAHDGALRGLLTRFQVDVREVVPVAALDERSLEIAAMIDPHADPNAVIDSDFSATAMTTLELRRLARSLPDLPPIANT